MRRLMMIGLARSQGPLIAFLYFCNEINHQLQPPMVIIDSNIATRTPSKPLFHGQTPSFSPPNIRPTPSPAPTTRRTDNAT